MKHEGESVAAEREQVVGTQDPPDDESGLPQNIGRNVGVNYAAVLAIVLAALITTPIMLNQLGDEAFGIFTLAGSVVVYLQLFDMGFGAATIRQIAADAHVRPEQVVRTLNTNMFALLGLGLFALVGGIGVAFLAPALFDVDGQLAHDTVVTIIILSVALAISIPLDTLGGVLAAYQRFDWLSLCNISVTVLSAVGGCVAVLLGFGLIGAGIASAAAAIGLHVVRWHLVRKLVPGVRISPRLVDRHHLRGTTRESGWFMVRNVTDVVINQVDVLVVGIMLGPAAVAAYAVGLKLAQVSRRAMRPLTQVFFPHASTLANNDQSHRLGALLSDGTRVSLAIATPITLVLSLFALPLLDAWGVTGELGDQVQQAVWVLVLLSIARGLTAITGTAWWLLAGAGWIKVTALVAAAESVVNLILSVGLAKPLGPAGVALGTLIGTAVVGVPASLVLARRLTGLPFREFVQRSVLPQVLPGAVIAVLLVAANAFHPTRVLVVLAVAGTAFVVYVLLYLMRTPVASEREQAFGLLRVVRRRLPGASVS